MRVARIVAICIAILLPASAAAAQCLKANEETQVAGKLVVVRFTDYTKQTVSAFILQLTKPACLEGPDEFDKVARTERIHVYPVDDAMLRRLRAHVGKTVTLRGKPFGEHTRHHRAPIVMGVTAIR